ncbi:MULTISPECIES: YbaK/EbsC family protein [unclassified Halomonas]|uniref:YbaK/EbsC family protein n=1 Tax=unclassified Halomonas TaxID=2609666 RepID=UPI00209E2497|nr:MULTISPECIES: YbaK/EbsC family protein [unclassified Halomonas]MCP1312801.1 YbaK/EbsC family protein [Halomonas sp. 707D7]MCP1326941.1 YbaK/EbsC family protein [Halomonas sp. 707D4]
MSIDTARGFLAEHAPDIEIIELEESTATVELAARAHGVEPGQIAKTLVMKVGEQPFLVVAAGDTRLDNAKVRERFDGKAKMLDEATVMELTSHPVGGVCPFGLATALPIYCDESLKRFDEVLPAAGSPNSAVRIAPERLATLVGAEWLDVCSPA